MPAAVVQPEPGFLANRKTDKSLIPMCIAALQNQDHSTTCQKVYLVCPGKGSPPWPQMFQKSAKLATPNCPKATIPQAMKAITITGDIQLAAFDTVSYPLPAMIEITAPTRITITIQVSPFGMVSVSLGISIFRGTPTAVADTVIIAPAKKQKSIPLARLYPTTSFFPQIFSRW